MPSYVYGTVEAGDATQRPHVRATLFACFISLGMFAVGYNFGVINGAAVLIKRSLRSTTLEITLMVTMTLFGGVFGAPCGSFAADACGRRRAQLLTSVLLVAGPLLMAFSSQMWMLIAFRGLVGFASGLQDVLCTVFVAEVAPALLRGKFGAMIIIFHEMGIMGGYLVNFALLDVKHDWRWMLGLAAVIPFIQIPYLLCTEIESPRWLLAQGRNPEATRMMDALEISTVSDVKENEFVSWGDLLCSKSFSTRRMLFASLSVSFASLGCGRSVIATYSSDFLVRKMTDRAAFLATILMGFVQVLTVLLVMLILDRVGRRPMYLVSITITMGACCWTACACWRSWEAWILAASFMVFMIGSALGQGPVPRVYYTEVFETQLRAKGTGLALITSRLVGSLWMLFPLLIEIVGIVVSFLLLASANVLAFGLIWMFMIETNGGSAEDMAMERFGRGLTPESAPECSESTASETSYLAPDYSDRSHAA